MSRNAVGDGIEVALADSGCERLPASELADRLRDVKQLSIPRNNLCCLVAILAALTAAGCTSPNPALSRRAQPRQVASGPSRSPAEESAAGLRAILAASDLPQAQRQPLPGDKLGATVHRLSNGMTVYISTNRQKPQFSAWVVVRAGSRVAPPNSTGLAHYLEHMMFKGTDELATLDYARERKHLDQIAQLYDKLRDTTDESERFAKTKRKLDPRYRASRVEPRNAVAWLASWEEAGFKTDPRPARWKRIRNTDQAAMMAFARQVTHGDIIVSVMGDGERFDVKALEKFGTVTVVKASQLFGY